MFQGSFRVFQVGLRGIPRDLQECFKGTSRVSKRSSKGVSKEFQERMVLRPGRNYGKKVKVPLGNY